MNNQPIDHRVSYVWRSFRDTQHSLLIGLAARVGHALLRHYLSAKLAWIGQIVFKYRVKKVFSCDNIPTIFWWQKRKLVELHGANASTIRQKLFPTLSDVNVMKDSDDMSTQLKTNSTPICSCNELSTDLEGIKLDLTISEAKQDKAIGYNTRIIEQIRTEVNNMQIQYRKLNEKISDVNHAMETFRLSSENSFLSQTLGNLTVALENHGTINEENKSCSSPLSQSENSVVEMVTIHANSDASFSPSTIEVNQAIKQNRPMPRVSVSCLASPAISTITSNDPGTQNSQMSHKCAFTLVVWSRSLSKKRATSLSNGKKHLIPNLLVK